MLERLTNWLAGSAAEDLIPRQLGFNAPFSLAVCLALLAAAGIGVGLWYWRRLSTLPRARRITLVGLRSAFVVLLLFLALDPAVIAQHVRPGEQFVALLFDDSLSMRIADANGESRGAHLQSAYAAAKETFEDKLKQRNQVVRYRVGEGAEPLREVEDLTFSQKQSDLTGSIAQVAQDLQGAALSGVVLFSDGVQLTDDAARALHDIPGDVPVFTVGVGESAAWSDIEITGLNVKRTDFDQSPVVLTVDVNSVGLAGREANVEVAVGSRAIKSKRISITDPVQDHQVRLEFIPDRKDWIDYEARVSLVDEPAAEGAAVPKDRIAENNVRHFVVDNRERTYRILYVSSRPNWQNKFFRLALEPDRQQLKLTSLIAISNAEQKFEFRGKKSTMTNPLFEGFEQTEDRPRYDETVYLRLGAEKDELTAGYPVDPKELFKFDLLILGDVDRAFFTTEQLELTRDFVDRRGGTLLMLGGPHTLTRGGYSGTVLEKLLPVLLYQEGTDAGQMRVEGEYHVQPTPEGRLAGSWLFNQDEEQDARLWSDLPPLYGLDQFPLVRAGATVMAVAGEGDADVEGAPVFAVQRYGEGRCAVLATGDTWQWQMRTESMDDRHARFWRQITRNLVNDVPDAAIVRDKRDTYTQDAPATFAFLVRDKAFERREALQCTATVTKPNGETTALPVDESLKEVGVYSSPYTPEEPGLYKLSLVAANGKGETVAQVNDAFLVQPDYREFQTAQYNPGFLRKLAAAHGGGFYSLDELDALAGQIPVPEVRDAQEVILHLWHLPGFYIALVAMMIGEWYLRRKAGRA